MLRKLCSSFITSQTNKGGGGEGRVGGRKRNAKKLNEHFLLRNKTKYFTSLYMLCFSKHTTVIIHVSSYTTFPRNYTVVMVYKRQRLLLGNYNTHSYDTEYLDRKTVLLYT